MPELPEVETTRRGIEPHLTDQVIIHAKVFEARLRWPVDAHLPEILHQQTIHRVGRRGKYLLIDCDTGTLIMHLGMSGSCRITDLESPKRKHDHLEIGLSNQQALRYHDPRRFGAVLWTQEPLMQHRLLAHLGPEPLLDGFDVGYLQQALAARRQAIKVALMDNRVVVGIGNIYASEALFKAKINPMLPAQQLNRTQLNRLIKASRQILQAAIDEGGTTLRDFIKPDHSPGYFQQTLQVYGRQGEPCYQCPETIQAITLAQRSTYYCPRCQDDSAGG